ncbi:PRA1 family protein F2-like [Hibiscus syriacus]|uniref:PRA1 family protein F2-like n=1 Tax=Hibiscus syriacus TaxID=106335 RepID=UPI001924F0CB|nr:PRA1 family protein F2-like [Hibiscus syriacus]
MTTYGTIPTSSSPGPSANIEYLSRAKKRIKEGLGDRRPWKLMFNIRSFNFPVNLSDAISRVRSNVAYFRMNYAIIVLFVLFLSLLWQPISLIVFVAMMAAWLVLYFLLDEPLVIFRRTIDDRVVLIVLGVLTIVFLLLTDATPNILWSLLVGAVVVLVHASFRRSDDLYDEESAGLTSSS